MGEQGPEALLSCIKTGCRDGPEWDHKHTEADEDDVEEVMGETDAPLELAEAQNRDGPRASVVTSQDGLQYQDAQDSMPDAAEAIRAEIANVHRILGEA